MIIDIGNDFTRYPAGRYREDGDYTGENIETFCKTNSIPPPRGHFIAYRKAIFLENNEASIFSSKTANAPFVGAIGEHSRMLIEMLNKLLETKFS